MSSLHLQIQGPKVGTCFFRLNCFLYFVFWYDTLWNCIHSVPCKVIYCIILYLYNIFSTSFYHFDIDLICSNLYPMIYIYGILWNCVHLLSTSYVIILWKWKCIVCYSFVQLNCGCYCLSFWTCWISLISTWLFKDTPVGNQSQSKSDETTCKTHSVLLILNVNCQ